MMDTDDLEALTKGSSFITCVCVPIGKADEVV